MSAFLRKYGVLTVTGTTAIRIPMIKRGVVDFALGADWTPVAGDVKIAIDGAAAANVTNLPTAVAMGNTAYWEFIPTAAELTCKSCVVTIADAATKAVEDNAFIIETFGHASAMYQVDFSDSGRFGLTALPNAAAGANTGLPVVGTQVPNATAGASNGLLISGSNAGTTTLASLTVIGALSTGSIANAGTTSLTGAVTAPAGITANITGTITTATNVTTVNGLAANVITAASAAADFGAEVADAVWDEATAGHVSAGSTGLALSAAGSAGDPWSTALPGAYGAGTAGKIVGDNVNATISSRSSLDAAGVRTAVGLASSNLDTQLAAIAGYVDTEIAQIVTLLTAARAEPGQGAPAVNPTVLEKVDYLYKAWRNKKDNDGTTTKLYADNGTTVDQKQTTSESAGTVTKAEWITGP